MPPLSSLIRPLAAAIALALLLTGCEGDGDDDSEQSPAPGTSVAAAEGEPEGRLAFVSFREGDQEIFIKDLLDGEEINLTQDPSDDFDPDISEDGTKVAFVSNREGVGTTHIYVIGSGGGEAVQLTSGSAGAQTPRWSRDGSRIAYSLGGAGIAVMDADGGNVQTILDAVPGEQDPCKSSAFVGGWSPDDSEIVYYSSISPEEGQLCIIPSDGGGVPEVLLAEPGEFAAEPVISPDGKTVVYRGIVNGQHDVWLLDLATADRTNLTDDPDLDIEPEWSPDGQWIAYGALRPDAPFFDLFVMRPDGMDVRQVTTDPAKEANPVWGKSGE